MLTIRLLGRFEVRSGDLQISLPSRKAQSLFAYLVLSAGVNHRREKVAGILWPESSENDARRKLRYALWQLRGALGEAYFTADRIHIGFNSIEEFWLDVAELKHGLDMNLSKLELRQIAGLYSGDLLPDLYEDWLNPERSRLRAVFEQIMERLISQQLSSGDYADVIEAVEQWINAGDPPEKVFRALMAVHTLLGEPAAATRSYQRCVDMLEADLAAAPSEKTEELHELILAGAADNDILVATGFRPQIVGLDPLQESSPDPQLPTAAEVETVVGRRGELLWLKEKWQAAVNGAGSFALVSGEAGRGKSALLWHFASQLLDDNPEMVVAAGRGEAYFSQGDPYLLFRDVLSLLAGDVEGRSTRETISSENAHRLWKLVPDTCSVVLDTSPDLLESFLSTEGLMSRAQRTAPANTHLLTRLQQRLQEISQRPAPIHVPHGDVQRSLFEGYSRVIRSLASRRPILILLDDLHWADRGSLDMLFHLGRRIDSDSVLIIGALRPEEITTGQDQGPSPLEQLLAEFGRIYGPIELNLDQADSSKGEQLCSAILDREPNSYNQEFREQMAHLTDGHPLFTLELLHQMKERGELAKNEEGRWFQVGEIDWEILPARVEAVIAGRILQLSSDLREVLSIASVEGERFTVEVAAAALNCSTEEVLKLLDRDLHRRHFLVEPAALRQVGAKTVSRYRFQHQLFQNYVYARQEPALRAQRHERVARALEEIYEAELNAIAARLARHFESANLRVETVSYLLKAAQYAKRQSADWEAMRALQRGLKLLQMLPPSTERDEMELSYQAALGPSAVALHGWSSSEAEAAFEGARQLAESLGRSEQLPPVLWGLWSYYLVRGKQHRAMLMAEQVLDRVQDDHQSELFLTAHWTVGISSVVLGRFEQARHNLSLAASNYDEKIHREMIYRYGQSPGVTCTFWLALSQWLLGERETALATCRSCLELSERENHIFSRAFGLACSAGLYAIDEDPETTWNTANEALRLARKEKYPFLRGMALIFKGWAEVMTSGTGRGVGAIDKGLLIIKMSGGRLFLPFFLSLAAAAQLRLGDFDASNALVDQAFEVIRQDGDVSIESRLHQIRARLLAAEGASPQEIVAELDRSYEIANRQGAQQLVQMTVKLREELLES